MSGLVDLVLGVVVLEAAGLLAFRFWTGRGIGMQALLLNLAAGLFLLLALRLGLGGAGAPLVLLCVALAGLAHLGDLRMRWQGS